MEFQDKNLNCVDCGTEFIWTAGEQLFFADKNFKNEPKRCKSCKAKRASRPAAGAAWRGSGWRRRPIARHAARKPRSRSGPRKAGRCSAASASSSGSSRERRRLSPELRCDIEGHAPAWPFLLCTAPRIRSRLVRRRRLNRSRLQLLCRHASIARELDHMSTIVLSLTFTMRSCCRVLLARVSPSRRLRRRRRPAAAAGRAAPPPAGVTLLTLEQKPIEQTSEFIATRAVAALDNRAARSRRPRDTDLREVGRPRPRRRAARPDQRRQAAGGRAQRGSQPRRHRGRRRSTGGSRSSASRRWSTRGPSADRSSIRRRTRCARPRRASPRSTPRCAKSRSSCGTTASTRRRPASSATSRSGRAIASRRRP